MDAVKGTAGILRLIHQCFIYIRQARAFEEEFGLYQLQLKVHLSRCATVSRIIYDTDGGDNNLAVNAIEGSRFAPEYQEPTITELLSSIQSRLYKAQQEAAKLEAGLVRFDSPPPEDATGLDTLRIRMTGLMDEQKFRAARIIEGLKWACYKKKKNDKFITDISSLIKHLERKVSYNQASRPLTVFGDTRIMYIARAHSSIM
ncbi:hypothetical protein V8C35DRAFT_328897 [Trichoderma chlorosporum]